MQENFDQVDAAGSRLTWKSYVTRMFLMVSIHSFIHLFKQNLLKTDCALASAPDPGIISAWNPVPVIIEFMGWKEREK